MLQRYGSPRRTNLWINGFAFFKSVGVNLEGRKGTIRRLLELENKFEKPSCEKWRMDDAPLECGACEVLAALSQRLGGVFL